MSEGQNRLPDSIEARLAALAAELRTILTERDSRYQVQFLTLRDAAELNNKAVSIAMDAAEKAIVKAEMAVEKRFDNVNEFRAQMADMQSTLARTDVMNARFSNIEKRIDELTGFQSTATGRGKGLSDAWGWLVGIAGVVVAALAFFFRGGSQ